MKIKTLHKKLLADTLTPVSIYLRLRDQFPHSILMESSDYHSSENSFSFICALPFAGFEVNKSILTITDLDNGCKDYSFNSKSDLMRLLNEYISCFSVSNQNVKIPSAGFFGYLAYDAARNFESIKLNYSESEIEISEMSYKSYQFVIAIDHFRNEIHLFENLPDGKVSRMEEMISLIRNRNFPLYSFKRAGDEISSMSDKEFLKIIAKGKEHCQLGDVFQIVLSRKFSMKFKGDDFNVYRALRSINPSPYLFYFDFGNYRIFGSSPEAQLIIKNNKASIYPIAGTFKRKGNDEEDRILAKQLVNDTKENSEHVMLVDLARNDLSRSGTNIELETFKEIQFYSHVIHLVSKVTADLPAGSPFPEIIADTFPAGTLSGAPKYRAMELIDSLEKSRRGFYGGAIGYLGFNGDFNHAIMIRSFLSKENNLVYQAGAGIVAKSNLEKELEEVNNKLSALRKAIVEAENINDR